MDSPFYGDPQMARRPRGPVAVWLLVAVIGIVLAAASILSAVTIDTRDFAGHPTSGVVLRGVAARYDERSRGLTSFNRYEAEAAGFLPLAGSRVVLATHGWVVQSDTKDGQFVPFFLQPSLGGVNTLRSYTDYRFHDDNMVVANIEARIAMMTHLDFALFADDGNVAGQPPFRGALKHHGWIATSIRLPAVSPALDPRVIAPAEVEL